MENKILSPVSIQTNEEYFLVMGKIEGFLKKATQSGGFESLLEMA